MEQKFKAVIHGINFFIICMQCVKHGCLFMWLNSIKIHMLKLNRPFSNYLDQDYFHQAKQIPTYP